MLESGATVTMADVSVGDRVLIASMDGSAKAYSEVIVKPHGDNAIVAAFTELVTVSGKTLKVTPDHLVLGGSCSSAGLVSAGSLQSGDCVQTVSGSERVVSVRVSEEAGIHTVVTKESGLLVVNGVVASPFASNHMVGDAFYQLHRAAHSLFSSVSGSLVLKSLEAFGDLMVSVF